MWPHEPRANLALRYLVQSINLDYVWFSVHLLLRRITIYGRRMYLYNAENDREVQLGCIRMAFSTGSLRSGFKIVPTYYHHLY